MYQLLNCSNDSRCSLGPLFESSFVNNYYIAMLSISSITVIMTSVSSFIFTFIIKPDTPFLKLLHLYSLNSLFVLLNDFIMALIYLISNPLVYLYNGRERYTDNYGLEFWGTLVYINLRQIFFFFGSILEIYIVYERLGIYDSKWKFFKNISNKMLWSIIFTMAFFINLPFNIGRDASTKEFFLTDTNSTKSVYFSGSRQFEYSEILDGVVFVCSIIRDIVTLALEILLTIILIYKVHVFWHKKNLSQKNNAQRNILFKARARSNLKICFTLCLLSTMYHSLSFSTFMAKEFDKTPGQSYYILIGITGSFAVHFKYAMSFIIFYMFNNKFRSALFSCLLSRRFDATSPVNNSN